MKKAILFFIATTVLSCERKEVDYTNQLYINNFQTWQIQALNNRFHKEIKPDEKLDIVFAEMDKIDSTFEVISDEFIWVCGGFKDSLASELVNPNNTKYTEKYFYENNFVRDNAIDFYLYQIAKWDELFIASDLESISINAFNEVNMVFNSTKVSFRKTDIFKGLKPIEALILISTIQRQLQVDKYNLLVSQIEK